MKMPKVTVDLGTLDQDTVMRINNGIHIGLRSLGEAVDNIEVLIVRHPEGVPEGFVDFLSFRLVIVDPIVLDGKREKFERAFNVATSNISRISQRINEQFMYATGIRQGELSKLQEAWELEHQKAIGLIK